MLRIDPAKLNHTFSKHGRDFGITGPWNKTNAPLLEQAIHDHVNDPAVVKIVGTYRGTIAVTHYLNPATDLWVAIDMTDNLVAGWKLSPAQKSYLLRLGNIQ